MCNFSLTRLCLVLIKCKQIHTLSSKMATFCHKNLYNGYALVSWYKNYIINCIWQLADYGRCWPPAAGQPGGWAVAAGGRRAVLGWCGRMTAKAASGYGGKYKMCLPQWWQHQSAHIVIDYRHITFKVALLTYKALHGLWTDTILFDWYACSSGMQSSPTSKSVCCSWRLDCALCKEHQL